MQSHHIKILIVVYIAMTFTLISSIAYAGTKGDKNVTSSDEKHIKSDNGHHETGSDELKLKEPLNKIESDRTDIGSDEPKPPKPPKKSDSDRHLIGPDEPKF